MRKIVGGLAISLDGVVEAPENWMLRSEEMDEAIGAAIAKCDAILLGRRTYLEFAQLWPNVGSDVPMADFMNNTPKHIASSTLEHPLDWANSRLVTGDVAGAIEKLKEQPGRNIVIPGSPRLVRSLLRDGLVDELSLMIQPVVVGSGMRLFDEMTDRTALNLVESTTLSNGVLSVTYQPTSA